MMAWIELALLLVLLVGAAVLAAGLIRGWRGRKQQARTLERLQPRVGSVDPVGQVSARPGKIERRLRAAGMRVGAPVSLLVLFLAAVLIFLIALELFPGRFALAALISLVALWVPWALLGAWARRRAALFEEKLTDAVGYMMSALQVGENPTRALASAADAAERPVARELARVVTRLEAGTPIRPALRPLLLGYDSEGLRLFAQTLIAKWSAGGDMAPILRSIRGVMGERLAMRLRLRSELAGARLSAVLVALMPYALIPVLLWKRPEWMATLVRHPLGLQLLITAILLQLVGFVWLWRIMRLET